MREIQSINAEGLNIHSVMSEAIRQFCGSSDHTRHWQLVMLKAMPAFIE